MAQRTWAPESLSEKYQCPELCSTRLEISPTSHTNPISCSSRIRTALLRRLTVKIVGLVAGTGDFSRQTRVAPLSGSQRFGEKHFRKITTKRALPTGINCLEFR